MFNKKNIKVPSKTKMNLYQPNTKNDPKRIIGIAALIFLIAAAILGRFVVYEGILEIRELEATVEGLNTRLSTLQAKTANYNELKDNYYRYSESYAKDKTKLVDRIKIIELLDESVKDIGSVTSTSISQNNVNIKLVTTDMEKIAQLRTILESNPRATDVVVYSAARSTGDVVATISFRCVVLEEDQ